MRRANRPDADATIPRRVVRIRERHPGGPKVSGPKQGEPRPLHRLARGASSAGRAALASLLLAGGAEAAERRCGWFENPTPANYTLRDRAGPWIMEEMGGTSAEGMDDLGDYAARGWVGTNGSYGYGCACVTLDPEPGTRRVARVHRVEPMPLSRCRADRALPPPFSTGRR